jgi:hypothetical protein
LLENVSKFKYLGTTVTKQNYILEEVKRRINSGNACYHSPEPFIVLLAAKKWKRIYKTIVLPMVLFG